MMNQRAASPDAGHRLQIGQPRRGSLFLRHLRATSQMIACAELNFLFARMRSTCDGFYL